jgi:suppressor of G2 allele of SKP1
MDQASRGAAALSAGNFDEAIKEYTAAIALNSNSPDYFIKRSTAYQRASPPQYDAALSDADTAVVLAHKRAKRELIAQAQLRRAIILFGLERYADAKFVLDVVKRLNEKEKTLPIWENKINQKMKALSEDDEKAKVTVKELPDIELQKPEPAATSQPTAATKIPEQTPPSKIKHDWYQNNDKVYFTLLAKGVPKDRTTVEINDLSISITFPTIAGSTFEYSLDPLFAQISPSESTYTITPSKVELGLKKATPGIKWSKLEGTEAPQTSTNATAGASSDPIKQAVLAAETKAPAYPTSSKAGPKDWDAVARDLSRKPKVKTSDDDEGEQEWEEDDLEAEGDPASGFFKKLFKNADDDTKKAMMKSYQESGGTVLSTNWSEVSKKKVEISPPDGMEAKNWDE